MITIVDYLKAHNNELAGKLRLGMERGVFLESSEVYLRALDGEWWCDVFLRYTLSCNDLVVLGNIFSDCWFCISPIIGDYGLRFSIDVHNLNLDDTL